MPVDAFLSVHYPFDRMSVDPIGETLMAMAENKSERVEIRTTSNPVLAHEGPADNIERMIEDRKSFPLNQRPSM